MTHDLTKPGIVRALFMSGKVANPFARDMQEMRDEIALLKNEKAQHAMALNEVAVALKPVGDIIKHLAGESMAAGDRELLIAGLVFAAQSASAAVGKPTIERGFVGVVAAGSKSVVLKKKDPSTIPCEPSLIRTVHIPEDHPAAPSIVEAAVAWVALRKEIKARGLPPHQDYWHSSLDETNRNLIEAVDAATSEIH